MTKKFYLTRTQTRAMAADHPIGDPTGGAAYGEKNDPITAIVSIASMAGTYAAAGSFAAMTVMQGITFAGAALSLVGNVTGNKTLSKVGMIAGLAGGVGMFAESQGLFSSGTLGETFGMNSAAATDDVLKAGSRSVTPVVDGKAVADVTTNTSRELAAAQTSAVPSPEITARSLAAPDINTAPGTAPSFNSNLNPGTVPGKDILGQPLRGPAQMSYVPGTGPNASLAPPATPGVIDSIKAGNYGQALSKAGGNAMDMLKNNPTGAYVAAQAVGAAADWLSGKTDAELDALKANTGYANAKALEVQAALDREKMRRANLNSGYTNVDAGFKVNPNAAVAQPYQQPPGLVAGAMQPRQG
jgi:hypothetical protein